MNASFADAEQTCRGLIIGFYGSIDQRRATDSLASFASDVSFETPDRLVETESLGDFLESRSDPNATATIHVLSNERFQLTEPHRAAHLALLLVYFAQSDGHFRLERALSVRHNFTLSASGWKIAGRVLG